MRTSTLYSVISCCAWLAASINSGEAIAPAGTQRQPVPEAAAEQSDEAIAPAGTQRQPVPEAAAEQSGEAIAPAGTQRQPVPEAAAEQRAMALLREAFGREYDDAKTPAEKSVLAKKLLDQATATAGADAERYVLLKVGGEIAARAGDAELTIQAVDAMADAFVIHPLQSKTDALAEVARSARLSTQKKALAAVAADLVDEAITADDFELAATLAKIALDAARGRDTSLLKRVVASNKKRAELQKAYAEVERAMSKLDEKPTDPEANQTVGSYLCLKKGDWENGISMLALGTDAALKQLAQQELQDLTSPDEQAALGDRWWELAQSRDGPEKQSLLLRAGHWYREALPDLSSQLLKAKIEKRLDEIDKLASSASQPSARSRSRGKTQPKPHYLTTMQESDVVMGPWPLGKFGKQGGRSDTPIAVKGVAFQFGLGVHPPSGGHSSVKYQLGKKARRFVTGAAVANGGKTSRSAITFLVLGDGKLLWISAPTRTEQVQICDVSVAGVDVLELRVECPGDNHLAWACWLDPYVIDSPR